MRPGSAHPGPSGMHSATPVASFWARQPTGVNPGGPPPGGPPGPPPIVLGEEPIARAALSVVARTKPLSARLMPRAAPGSANVHRTAPVDGTSPNTCDDDWA